MNRFATRNSTYLTRASIHQVKQSRKIRQDMPAIMMRLTERPKCATGSPNKKAIFANKDAMLSRTIAILRHASLRDIRRNAFNVRPGMEILQP